MIYYYQAIPDSDLTLSIDNIILDVSITDLGRLDPLNQMLNTSVAHGKGSILTWQSFKPGTFRRQTLIQIDEDRSFWIGQGLNGKGTLEDRVRLDFNPNKVGNNPNFKIIREFLVRNSRASLCRIPRFDLAIDIPVAREKCFLVKDRRLYIERRHGVEFTQYLGSKASTVGRVKLYNKSAEAKLDYPLTRLELTLDPSKSFDDLNMPEVFVIDDVAMAEAEIRLTETERFILNAVLQGCGKVTDLGRKTSEKMKRVLKDHLRKVEISEEIYSQALYQINEYRTEGAIKEKEKVKNEFV